MVIVDEMFSRCELLRTIIIPDSVSLIGAKAFMGCYSLKSFKSPQSQKLIGDRAFIHFWLR